MTMHVDSAAVPELNRALGLVLSAACEARGIGLEEGAEAMRATPKRAAQQLSGSEPILVSSLARLCDLLEIRASDAIASAGL